MKLDAQTKASLESLASIDGEYERALEILPNLHGQALAQATFGHAEAAPDASGLALAAATLPTFNYSESRNLLLAWQRLSRQKTVETFLAVLLPISAAARQAADELREKQAAAAVAAGMDGWVENSTWKALDSFAGRLGVACHHCSQAEWSASHLLRFLEGLEPPQAATPEALEAADAAAARLGNRGRATAAA